MPSFRTCQQKFAGEAIESWSYVVYYLYNIYIIYIKNIKNLDENTNGTGKQNYILRSVFLYASTATPVLMVIQEHRSIIAAQQGFQISDNFFSHLSRHWLSL